jgi:DNA polymerase-3 subunit delta'
MDNPNDLFAGLVGQAAATALLQAALDQQRLAPAYLFSGADGVGRALAARRFLEGVIAGPAGDPSVRRRLQEGNHPDLLWLEPTYQHQGQLIAASEALAAGISRKAPPQLRLEQVRSVSQFLGRRPLESPRCLVVIEAVEAMAEGAANALLKTLEEPGGGLLILLNRGAGTPAHHDPLPLPADSLSPPQPRRDRRGVAAPGALAGLGLSGRRRSRDHGRIWGEPRSAGIAGAGGRLARCPAAVPRALACPAGGSGRAALELGQSVPGSGLPPGPGQANGDPIEALALARDLCEALDGEQQLWLLNRWQWRLWRQRPDPGVQRRLEGLRSHLRSYVQPRLAWEVALLELSGLVGPEPATRPKRALAALEPRGWSLLAPKPKAPGQAP